MYFVFNFFDTLISCFYIRMVQKKQCSCKALVKRCRGSIRKTSVIFSTTFLVTKIYYLFFQSPTKFSVPNKIFLLTEFFTRPSAELACRIMKNMFVVGWRMDRSFSTTRTLARYDV